MAVSILQAPLDFTFSGNPVLWRFGSDAHLVGVGAKAVHTINSGISIPTGTKFIFSFGNEYTEMIALPGATADGNNFPTGSTSTALIPFFAANYTLSKYFDIEADGVLIKFTAKEKGTAYNFKPQSFFSTVTQGADDTQQANFKFILDVFFKRADESTFRNIYTEELFEDEPLTGITTYDASNVLDAVLEFDLPDFNSPLPEKAEKSKGQFFIRVAELYGAPATPKGVLTSDIKHVAKGGLSTIGFKSQVLSTFLSPVVGDKSKDIFLKQGPKIIRTRTNQAEVLAFVNMRSDTTGLSALVKVVYTDDTENTFNTASINVARYDKVYFKVGYDVLGIGQINNSKTVKQYTVNLIDQSFADSSTIFTYKMDFNWREKVRYFVYQTSWGSYDTLATYGKGEQEYERTLQVAESFLKPDYLLTDGDSKEFDVKLQAKFKVATNYLDPRRFDLLNELYLSEQVYLQRGAKYIPVRITNNKFGSYKDGNNQRTQMLEYEFKFKDHYYTEGDVEEPGDYIDGFFFWAPGSGGVSATETDPTVPLYIKAITPQQISGWNDVYAAWINGDLGGGSVGVNDFIRNQTTLQSGANFYVQTGRFADKLSLPTAPPSSLENGEAALWIGSLSGITNDAGYTLPVATDTVLGGVKIGNGLVIDANGVLSVTALGGVTSFNSRTGAITLNSSDVTGALGYTPYNSSNPAGYITAAALSPYALASAIPTNNNQLTNGAGYITAAALGGYATESWVNTNYVSYSHLGANYISVAVSDARYQPIENQRLSTNNNVIFNKLKAADTLFLPTTAPSSLASGEAALWIGSLSGITNDAGYTLPIATAAVLGGVRIGSGLTIDGSGVLSVTALGGVTSFNSRTGAISLLSSDVTGALGFTPYNSSNPAGYITSAALSPYALSSSLGSAAYESATNLKWANQTYNGQNNNGGTLSDFLTLGTNGIWGYTSKDQVQISLLGNQFNWANSGSINYTVGLMAWRNYGNSHVIFDASAGLSPSGTSINRDNSQNAWQTSFPTLMGWNGFQTYGVRVDSARVADFAGSTNETLASVTARGNSTASRIVSVGSDVNSSWGNAGFETFGTNPGYGFHYPGVYGASLWMNAAGMLSYTGSGIWANYLEAEQLIRITSLGGAKRLLMGNQNSVGTNKPAIIQSANADIAFGYGDTWVGDGGNLTTTFFIGRDGNIAAGTTNPDSKFHIIAGVGQTAFKALGPNASILIGNVGTGENYYNANSFHQFQIGGISAFNVGSGYISSSGSINADTATGRKIGFGIGDNFSAYGTTIGHYGLTNIAGDSVALSGYYGLKFYTNGIERLFIEYNSGSTNFKGATGFDGRAALNLTNNASIYGRTQLRLTGRLDAGNDAWSIDGRNNIIFSRNNGGSQGALGEDRFALQYFMGGDLLGIVNPSNTSVWNIDQSGNTIQAGKHTAPTIEATNTLFIPTTAPSSIPAGKAAIWIGNLSGVTT